MSRNTSERLSLEDGSYVLPPNSPSDNRVDPQLLEDIEAQGPRQILELVSSQGAPQHIPLLEFYRISSCSELAYIPTPFNSPQINSLESKPSSTSVTLRETGSFTIGEGAMVPPDKPNGPNRSTPTKHKSRGNVLDDPNRVLTNKTSPIYHVKFNLKGMLQLPETERALESEDCAFKFSEVNSDELATAAAAFKEDGRNGFNEPQWMRQASEASKSRAAGDFDDYTRHLFQEHWAEEEETIVKGDKKNDDDDESDDANGKRKKTNQRPSARNSRNRSNRIASYDRSDDDDEHMNDEDSAASEEAVDPETVGDNESQPISRPPKYRIMTFASDGKLESICGPQPHTQNHFLRAGDILSLLCKNPNWEEGVYKEAEIVKAAPMDFIIKVAPQGSPYLSKDDHLNPRFRHIKGADDIVTAMKNQDPGICPDISPASRFNSGWKIIKVFRGGEELGTLHDIRQAWLFSQNEFEFAAMRNFRPGRKRRVHKQLLKEGYTVLSGCMFKKIHKDDMLLQNPRLILDLGREIMAGITSCANEGYRIFMVDNRIRSNDGMPVPMNVKLADIYEHGPNIFPTPLLRQLAGCAGWTGGFAHQGPLSLGKGWGTGIFSKGRAVNNRHPPPPLPKSAFLTPQYVPKDLVPHGVPFTRLEEQKLLAYCTDNVFGKLEHHPTMRTLYHRTVKDPPIQRVGGNPTGILTYKWKPYAKQPPVNQYAKSKGLVFLQPSTVPSHKSSSNALPKKEPEPVASKSSRCAAVKNKPKVLHSMTPYVPRSNPVHKLPCEALRSYDAPYTQPTTLGDDDSSFPLSSTDNIKPENAGDQDNDKSRYPPVPTMSPPRPIVKDRNGRWYSHRAHPVLKGRVTKYSIDGADEEFSDSNDGYYSFDGNHQVSSNDDDDGYWFIENSYPELSKEHRSSYFDVDGGNDGISDVDSGYQSLQSSRPSTSSGPSLTPFDPALYEITAPLNTRYHTEGSLYLPQRNLAASTSTEPAQTFADMSQDLSVLRDQPVKYERSGAGSLPDELDIPEGAHYATENPSKLPQQSSAAPNDIGSHNFDADIEQYLNQLDELAETSRDTSPGVSIPPGRRRYESRSPVRRNEDVDNDDDNEDDDEYDKTPTQDLPFTYYNETENYESMASVSNNAFTSYHAKQVKQSRSNHISPFNLPFPFPNEVKGDNPWLQEHFDPNLHALGGSSVVGGLSAPRAEPMPNSSVPRRPSMNLFSPEKEPLSYRNYAKHESNRENTGMNSASPTSAGMTSAGMNLAGGFDLNDFETSYLVRASGQFTRPIHGVNPFHVTGQPAFHSQFAQGQSAQEPSQSLSKQTTPTPPVKRRRGRPRKHPLPGTGIITSRNTSSPLGQVSSSIAKPSSSLRKVEYADEDFESESSPEPRPDKHDQKDGDYNPKRNSAWYKMRKST